MSNKIKGGKADGMSIVDLTIHHGKESWTSIQFESLEKKLKKELSIGIKVEMEHTNDKAKAREIAMDHLYELPDYYTRLEKMEKEGEEELDEIMGAGGAGSFEAPMGTPIKRNIYKPPTMNEAAPGGSGQYDMPAFVGVTKDPLKIAGEKAIGKRAKKIEKTKSFPKFGGPDAVFVKIKEKCKKFPYCNQDPDAIEILKEDKEIKSAITEVAKKRGIPYVVLENIVINEIKSIFI
jgi:hypothetical protein